MGFLLKETAFRTYERAEPSKALDGSLGATLLDKLAAPEELSTVTVGVVVNTISLITALPVMVLNQMIVSGATGAAQTPLSEALLSAGVRAHALPSLVAFEVANVLFNAALHSFLALKLIVPCVALLSGINWPLIGAHPTGTSQWVALLGMGVGIAGYQWGNTVKSRAPPPSAPPNQVQQQPTMTSWASLPDHAVGGRVSSRCCATGHRCSEACTCRCCHCPGDHACRHF
jgi:hypothetical protein